MGVFGEFALLFIQQFAGGPGPIENNLIRFGLAAIFWSVLLAVAWSRQKNQHLPREKLLIWGFCLALTRELMMFGLIVLQITGSQNSESTDIYYHPLEHGLEIAAVIVVAGAFLRYALNDEILSRRYLQVGLLATSIALLISYITWPKFSNANPNVKFSVTWESRTFHIIAIALIAAAIFILARKRDWLRSVVNIALGFFFISESLHLISYATDNAYSYFLCPMSNTFHILAIPIFGFVYLKEMSIEKKKAEDELDEYRNHLEYLVDERTAMLVAQNSIADSLSQSLDLETILNMALDKVLSVLSMEVGLIFLSDRARKGLSLGAYRGRLSQEDLDLCITEGCPYEKISEGAIDDKQILIQNLAEEPQPKFTHVEREGIQSLISAPLISKDHIVGALTLGSKKVAPPSQTDLELLAAVCNQIGMAVENAYLFQEAENWAGELSTLHQASINLRSTLDSGQINKEIALQSARLTGRQMVCVISWSKGRKKLEIISSIGIKPNLISRLSENAKACELLDELCTTRNSIVINDIQQDARIPNAWSALGVHSLLCTPIWGVDEATEFLFIMDQQETKAWRSKDVELVESFVSRAAVALENAHLYQQLEWAAALEERQRIAADMHDGLAQMISLLGLKVDHAVGLIQPESNGKILEALGDIREFVSQAATEARQSISSLQNTPQPRKSLQEILIELADKWLDGEAYAFNITLSFPEPLFLPPDHIKQVVPIVQEAIINARKHSNATQIQIHGEQSDDQISITIKDDGEGFVADEFTKQGESHFGLKIMHARAARFGGKLQIVSEPDNGTIVTLSWVLDTEIIGRKNGLSRHTVRQKLPTLESEAYA